MVGPIRIGDRDIKGRRLRGARLSAFTRSMPARAAAQDWRLINDPASVINFAICASKEYRLASKAACRARRSASAGSLAIDRSASTAASTSP